MNETAARFSALFLSLSRDNRGGRFGDKQQESLASDWLFLLRARPVKFIRRSASPPPPAISFPFSPSLSPPSYAGESVCGRKSGLARWLNHVGRSAHLHKTWRWEHSHQLRMLGHFRRGRPLEPFYLNFTHHFSC